MLDSRHSSSSGLFFFFASKFFPSVCLLRQRIFHFSVHFLWGNSRLINAMKQFVKLPKIWINRKEKSFSKNSILKNDIAFLVFFFFFTISGTKSKKIPIGVEYALKTRRENYGLLSWKAIRSLLLTCRKRLQKPKLLYRRTLPELSHVRRKQVIIWWLPCNVTPRFSKYKIRV